MSNIDKMNANEQLFTELTPEEGAVIEGGAEFKVLSLESFVSGANHGREDSLIVIVHTHRSRTRL